jgi:oligosaccharide reducing-end xylanase
VAINLAVDHVWFDSDPWLVDEADRWLSFFVDQGIDDYVHSYTLDGEPTVDYRTIALQTVNGALASIATLEERTEFMEDVVSLSIPSGEYRYYDGMLYMLSLLTLSGRFRNWLE